MAKLTEKEFKEEVQRLLDDDEVVNTFIGLNDLIREMAEEAIDTINDRKRVRNKVVKEMLNKYW